MRHLLALLCLLSAAVSVRAELRVEETDAGVIVSNPHYRVEFDKSRGGTITRLGASAVEQKDHADQYLLANDSSAQIAIDRPDPQRAVVTVSAHYVKDGAHAESEVRAAYRYLFHADSPVVSVDVTLRQQSYQAHSDVYLLPSWNEVTVLEIGDRAGYRGAFTTERLNRRLMFAPGAAKPFEPTAADVEAFVELTRLKLPVKATLLEDSFADKSHWVELGGDWRVSGGVLSEVSPSGQNKWIVCGSADWENYVVEADAHANDAGNHAFVCGRWQDEQNHYELAYLAYPALCLRLERVQDGRRVTLAEVGGMADLTGRDRSAKQTTFTRLALAMQGPRLRGYLDDNLVLEAIDTTFTRGRVALGAACEYQVAFTRFSVRQLEAPAAAIPALRLSFPPQRYAFYRDEAEAALRCQVTAGADASDVSAAVTVVNEKYITAGDVHRQTIAIGAMKAGEPIDLRCPLQPSQWRSGDYTVTIRITQGDRVMAQDKRVIYVRRRPNADRMLVNAWDSGDPGRYAEAGFNQLKIKHLNTMSRWHGDQFVTPDDPRRLFSSSGARALRQDYDRLDECVRHGMWGYIELEFTRRVAEGVKEAYALKRDASSLQDRQNDFYEKDQPRPNPWHPANVKIIQDHYREELKAFRDHPAWHATLLNSESTSTLDVYGNDYFLAMAKKDLGFDVPADVSAPTGVDRKKVPLPADGIIEDNNPYYRFYRWWAEKGEGQGQLFAKVAEVIREMRPDVRNWNDPVLRQPFVRGRLRGMDQVLHWSYLWPLPERFPLIADELRLASVDDQERLFMIQLIVWGEVAIPRGAPLWAFVKRRNAIPAQSPAVVRQGTWMALSRGVSGLSYHGIQTADARGMTQGNDRADVHGIGYSGYMYSNPDLVDTIRDLSTRVIQPYGMAIKRMKPVKGEVALLLSTATAVMTSGDAESMEVGQVGRLYAKLQAAHVPVDVLYEVDMEERGLDGYKAVALPAVRVLPRRLYDMVCRFSEAGGIVLVDAETVPKFPRAITIAQQGGIWDKGDVIQKDILDGAGAVHAALDSRVERMVDCDSPSVILSVLKDAGGQRLLFVTNTLRQPGDYMGRWGRVLDDGVPQRTRLKNRGPGVIYDVLARQMVKTEDADGWRTWEAALGAGEGRMYAILSEAPTELTVGAKPVRKGSTTSITIASGAAAKGLLPLKVEIRDSQGVLHDYSDYALAVDGKATVLLPIAINEPSGWWTVTVDDLYTGRQTSRWFEVSP